MCLISLKGYPDCPGGEDESNCLALGSHNPMALPGQKDNFEDISETLSPAGPSFNPFHILHEKQQQGEPDHQGQGESDCVGGGNKAGCSVGKLGQEDQQQRAEHIFNPFQVASGQDWIDVEGRVDPGQVVQGQVGSWEEDGSIFNPFSPTEQKPAQLEWPRWGELEVADLGVDGEEMGGMGWSGERVRHQPFSFPVFPAKPPSLVLESRPGGEKPTSAPSSQSSTPVQFVLPQLFANSLVVASESFTRKPQTTTSTTTTTTTSTTTTRTTTTTTTTTSPTTTTATTTLPTTTSSTTPPSKPVGSTTMSSAMSLIQNSVSQTEIGGEDRRAFESEETTLKPSLKSLPKSNKVNIAKFIIGTLAIV